MLSGLNRWQIGEKVICEDSTIGVNFFLYLVWWTKSRYFFREKIYSDFKLEGHY